MNNIGFTANYKIGLESIDTRFILTFMPVMQKVDPNWFNECVNTAHYIRNSTDKDIIIANSGGIDSEAVCWAFLAAGIKFKVLTVIHKEKTNLHDIWYSLEFCRRHNIECIKVDLDMPDFITYKIPEYINQGYRSKYVFRYFQLFLLETISSLSGTAVLGGGEQIYTADSMSNLCMFIEPSHLNTLQYCKKHNELHFPYFYQTRPELIASYLTHEMVSALIDKPQYFSVIGKKNPSYFLKQMIYHYYINDLQVRTKYHGNENIRNLVINCEKKLHTNFTDLVYLGKTITAIKQELNII